MNCKKTQSKWGQLKAQKKHCPKSKSKKIREQLGQTVRGCSTIEQLLELLFRTDIVKDEAILDAFDRRLEELDPTAQHTF